MKKTTISLVDTTVGKLKVIKVHPRQSFDELILELIKLRGNSK